MINFHFFLSLSCSFSPTRFILFQKAESNREKLNEASPPLINTQGCKPFPRQHVSHMWSDGGGGRDEEGEMEGLKETASSLLHSPSRGFAACLRASLRCVFV